MEKLGTDMFGSYFVKGNTIRYDGNDEVVVKLAE